MILQTAFNIVDTFFVGKLGSEAIAAVTSTFSMIFLLIAISTGIGAGTTSLIARRIGAKKFDDAKKVAYHSFVAFWFFTIVFTTGR